MHNPNFSLTPVLPLNFDLTVQEGGELNFKYAFGSEEYPEFVGLQFNDVFGFLVTPPSATAATNIAMIPGTNDPVAINFVNANLNAQYFVDNATNGNPDIVFGGMTTPLLATFSAVGGNTYHIKIGVADIGDVAFDSGVFIGIESLCGDSLLTPPAEAIATVNNNTVLLSHQNKACLRRN